MIVNNLGKKIRAAVPRVDDERRRVYSGRERWHTGVGLASDALADIAGARNGA